MAAPKKKSAKQKSAGSSGPPSLLVLQLDSDKLKSQGLSLATFAGTISPFCLGGHMEIVEATTASDLGAKLAALVERGKQYDVVVAIGHSNHQGIQVAADTFVGWDGFAQYLKPFGPRRVVLIACDGGRWNGANTLFRKLPKLRRIYASPVLVSKRVGEVLIALAPFFLAVKAPRDETVLKAQLALAIATGGQVRQWMRTRHKDDPAGMLRDLASVAADPLVRQAPSMIRDLLGRLFK